jgi:hypothetical protein
MTTHHDIQAAPETLQEVREKPQRPRRQTVGLAVFWGLFGLMTLSSAIYQMAFAEDGAGWLLLTFLYIFAALMIWESVGLFSKLRKTDR